MRLHHAKKSITTAGRTIIILFTVFPPLLIVRLQKVAQQADAEKKQNQPPSYPGCNEDYVHGEPDNNINCPGKEDI